MRTQALLIIISLIHCISFIPGLWGQTTGSIEGIVRDIETGEVLPGVQITIDGTDLTNTSGEDGYFFIHNVPPGVWDLTIFLEGFRKVRLTGQRILANQIHTIDFELKATILELPDLFSQGEKYPLLLSDHDPSRHSIPQQNIENFPVDDINDVITLLPGIVQINNVSNATYPTRSWSGYPAEHSRFISIRGGRPSGNAAFIDGIDITPRLSEYTFFGVPEPAIEEIDIYKGSAGSIYGDYQSGVVEVHTRNAGRDVSGMLRFETDELMPDGVNYGFNRAQISIGGPIPRSNNRLTFFFSGEATGYGDMQPRAGGFKGRNDDIYRLADRYSFDREVKEFLGYDLDINDILHSARTNNPDLPIMNVESYRTDEGAFPGRLIGNEGDETRALMKLGWKATRDIKLTGTFSASRDQGLIFDRQMIFWDSVGNGVFKNQNYLGIFSYDHTLSRSTENWNTIHFRASFQRNSQVQGPRFDLDDDSEHFGEDLGFEDLTNVLNYRIGGIPVFLEDLKGGHIQSYSDILDRFQYDFDIRTVRYGQNPFGVVNVAGFYDADIGYYSFLRTVEEDRANIKIDLDSQFGRTHRIRMGVDVKYWQVDHYVNHLTSSYDPDYYHTKPEIQSFYIEDRLNFPHFSLDLGMRLDTFYSGTEYFSTIGDNETDRIKPGRKTAISPRFNISHPLSDRTQIWTAYGMNHQIPRFSYLYRSINWNPWYGTTVFKGYPDLDFERTTYFEFGFTRVFRDDWVFELVGYQKNFYNMVAARYIEQENAPVFKIFTNDAFGKSRGFDTRLHKRFSSYFSTEVSYSLLSSRSTDTDPTDFAVGEGYGGVWPEPTPPPLEQSPNDYDQTHTINGQITVRFPDDFRETTRTGRILGNTSFYLTAQAHSGLPYSVITPKSGSWYGYEFSETKERTRWYLGSNLRVTHDFTWSGLEYTVFTDIRNLLGIKNLSNRKDLYPIEMITNGVYMESGSPYSDGRTVTEAIDDLDVDDPSLYTGPRRIDINGDGSYDELDDLEIIRMLDFNGDGSVSIEEDLAMRILARGAMDANPEHFDIPRLIRVGLEMRF